MFDATDMTQAAQMVSGELQERVRRELEPGEMIRWMEQPVPRFFSPATVGMVLFGIPWTAFALFWICGASGFKMPNFSGGGFALFPLFGLPFVLIGIGMLSSPLWAYRKALKTVYVITSGRALVIEAGRTSTIRSYRPDQLRDAYRKERRNGSGDVILGQRVWTDSDNDRRSMDVGFMNVRDAKRVERLVNDLAALARQETGKPC
jgi:hypothetical protein